MNTVRKNIALSLSEYETINNYAKKYGMSFSEFLIDTALKEIERAENMNLCHYINANVSYVDEHEQAEIEALNIDFDNTSGRELTLDKILES